MVLVSGFTLSYSEEYDYSLDDLNEDLESLDYFVEKGFEIYVLEDPYGEYYIPYKVDNLLVNSMTFDKNTGSQIFDIRANNNSTLTLVIPTILTAINTHDPNDDKFFIIINNNESNNYISQKYTDYFIFLIKFIHDDMYTVEIFQSVIMSFDTPDPFVSYDRKTTNSIFFDIYSPNKQLQKNILVNEILCNDNLHLIKKQHNNSPACVTETAKEKLLDRGWMLAR